MTCSSINHCLLSELARLQLRHTCAALLLCLPPLHLVLVTVALEAAACHAVDPFPNSLTCNGHCIESLVWLTVSGFCYAINTEPLGDLAHTSCHCPGSWRSCGYDPVGLAPSPAPAAQCWVCVEMGQFMALVSGLGGS